MAIGARNPSVKTPIKITRDAITVGSWRVKDLPSFPNPSISANMIGTVPDQKAIITVAPLIGLPVPAATIANV